tara:strand:- start:269 stop:589 length:321 start_codon:yes stop_codon:yes gene_type:complete
MHKWSPEIEKELTSLVKDWLKNKRKSQVDLKESLCANSSRMPSLMEILQKEYSFGGIPKVAEKLCSIEKDWNQQNNDPKEDHQQEKNDPFNQLDLILEELKDDFNN